MDKSSTSPRGPSERSAEERLDSWKEIALYLRREVRTVQRWEKRDGLPIHRLQHDKLGSVYAYKSELEAWVAQRDPSLEPGEGPHASEGPGVDIVPPAASDTAITGDGQVSSSQFRRTQRILLIAVALVLVVLGGYSLRLRNSKPVLPPANKVKLVVLPFRNLSDDPAQNSFIRGLTDEMTTQLGRLDPDGLGVIASTTAEQLKNKSVGEIGKEFNVDYVLEGSVLREGGRVRIDAELIQVSDQTHRWANSYERDMKDILALQSDVADSVAREIELTIKPEERHRLAVPRSVDPEAYDAFLQGLYYWNMRTPDKLGESVRYFQQAVDKDPRFAAAFAGLSSAYSLLSQVPNDVIPPREAMPRAKAAADQALKADPASAEAHAAMGLVLQSYDWDWKGAEQEYERAIEINPSYATARQWHYLLLISLGRRADALKEIQKAEEIDPLSLIIRSSRAQALYFDRQYDRVIEVCRKTLSINSRYSFYFHYHLGRAYMEKGMYSEGIAELQKAKDEAGGPPFAIAALGNAYGVSGRRAEALASLQELKRIAATKYVPSLYFAGVCIGLGDKDQAFNWLNKAVGERSEYLIYLNVEPMGDPLRSDPRFRDVLQRIGLLQ